MGGQPGPKIDLTGRTYGRLTVLSYAGRERWNCSCSCGTAHSVRGDALRAGIVNSCGCAVVEKLRAQSFRHGYASGGERKPEYRAWRSMLDRCERPGTSNFHRYGGRGIRVCERWREFQAFLADMGDRPTAKHSLDRIDNNGDYEPTNCRWATFREQQNNKSQNVMLEARGQRMSMREWSRVLNVPYQRIVSRVRHGWPALQALGLEARCRPTR